MEKASIEAFLLGKSQRSSKKNQDVSYSTIPYVARPTCSTMDFPLQARHRARHQECYHHGNEPYKCHLRQAPSAGLGLADPEAQARPNAPQFMQALAEAVETATSKTLQSEPGAMSRLVKPRSHLDLVSLIPVQTGYVPASAALEKVGSSRLVPFVAGG
jgi:hypothetical protein